MWKKTGQGEKLFICSAILVVNLITLSFIVDGKSKPDKKINDNYTVSWTISSDAGLTLGNDDILLTSENKVVVANKLDEHSYYELTPGVYKVILKNPGNAANANIQLIVLE